MAAPSKGGWGSAYYGNAQQGGAAPAPSASGGWGSAWNGGKGSAAQSSESAAPVVSSAGGWGSAWNSRPAPPARKQGGGLLGSIVGGVEHTLGSGAHYVAQKADLAAHDLYAAVGGAANVAEGIANTKSEIPGQTLGQEWKLFLTHPIRSFQETEHAQGGSGPGVTAPIAGFVQGSRTAVEHPLRDPFQTLVTVAPVAGGVARAGIAGDALRAGDAAGAGRALLSGRAAAARLGDRTINVPKLVAPEGEGPAQLVHEPVTLQKSEAPFPRLLEAAHDRLIQRALENETATGQPTRLSRYANSRVSNVNDELARTAQRTSLVPTQMLERAASHLPGRSPFDKGVSNKAGQLAMTLRSNQIPADVAARYWGEQAARGINPAETGQLAEAAQQIHDAGMLRRNAQGRLEVDAERYPKLASVDALTRQNQAIRAGVIAEHGLMSPEGMQNRLNLMAQKMGVQAEGEGFTSLKTSVKNPPQSVIARSRPPLIGRPRFSVGKKATGSGIEKGLIPDDTTAGVARATREALRYENTVTHRGLVARYGSDVKRTTDDALIADPEAAEHAEIPTNVREILGQQRSTLNTISEHEHQGLGMAMRAKLEDAIPGLGDSFAADREAQLGTRAPAGYKWVPRSQLGELVHETLPRSRFAKRVNDVNSTVTGMTVYFKLSHIPQRLTTNATTSLFQGSLPELAKYAASHLTHANLGGAIKMRRALTEQEYAEATAASGTHGYMALPHEGTSRAAAFATKGAQFYAHRIDSPVRFVNLYYEAKKAGIDTPDKFRELLAYAKHPDGRNATFQHVLGRANRASMMYDGLGENEKRILARGLWFYPWTKAAARFGGHVLMEHPVKAAVTGQLGAAGVQQQNQRLGPLPSYEYGLTPFGGGKTGDLAILTPFGTVSNVAEMAARPESVVGNANPVYGSLYTAFTGHNQYGAKTTRPIGTALSELLAPTPEAQILSAHLHPSTPNQIFRKTPESQFLRSLLGPSLPRPTNRAALNRAAARERAGR